ncbi:ATPase family associated with various cellular activities (AAA) [Paraburkholderia caribensis MBA4]|uniref:ATPase family associated with various cellular activities (AAA) n=2 Tax=Paraburkholderia caribensis TaxID=75105 RepID=A0A0P0RI52_9BURK|nr:ATPase family associated with various cellular activities (AAA) [Paraburkholderia caribensis MBA4]
MIPGGIADKLGNRYEAKWLALKLIEVVRGTKSALCFEGTSEAFAGFEFQLVDGDVKQWHQVKISNPSGNWSASRLQQVGVLESFRNRLELDDHHDECHFISQDSAASLRELSERARIANDYADLKLSQKLSEEFLVVRNAWSVSDEVAFQWLRRVYCRTQPERELDESIEIFGGLCLNLDGSRVFGALRDFMELRFNRYLTTDDVRLELSKSGVALKHWQLDATLAERLRSSTEDYRLSYSPIPAKSSISRSEAGLVVEELTRIGGANIILLTGGAGFGKSGVVHQVIAELNVRGIVHVAMRADELLDSETSADIGHRVTQRSESPVVTLKGVAPTATTVLFIDQVDAVSDASGRSTRLKSLLLRMLSDAEKFETVKVICACRAFDLDTDHRLKALTERNTVRRIELSLLDWESQVRPVLDRHGVAPDAMSANQRKLLQLPLNLGIFLEVMDEEQSFNSRNELFTALLEKKARAISRERKPAWSLSEPLDSLATWMSEHQSLQAPLSALRRFDSAFNILSSEGLITVRDNSVHFFHESLFDYLFASAFMSSRERSIVDLLTADEEQHLFRRTQVRQILESLRQDDRPRYLRELAGIFWNSAVRYHIRIAVAQWLGSVTTPTRDELHVVLRHDVSSERMTALARWALYGTPDWFDIAEAAGGLVALELSSPVELRRQDALWWLSRVAPSRPDKVGTLLERWYRSDASARGRQMLDWFMLLHGKPLTGTLLSLFKVVTKEQVHLLLDKTDSYRTSSLLGILSNDDGTEAVVEIVQTYFEAWFESHPSGHPFVRDQDGPDIDSLQKLATQSPSDFLVATTRALVLTIERIASESEPDRTDWTFRWRKVGPQYTASDRFLSIYREALRSVAGSEPHIAERFLSQLPPSAHPALLHLHLETIAAHGAALGHRLPDLLGEADLFEAGWTDLPHQSFADAARASMPSLPLDARTAIETAISNFQPELQYCQTLLGEIRELGEDSVYRSRARVSAILRESGNSEWSILETIGESALSERTRRRLAELRRKFPGRTVRTPQGTRAGFVGSPIPQAAIEKMNNRQWLKAIAEYESRPQRSPLDRGPEQLAANLLALTKNNPNRFANLLTQIPDSSSRSYTRNILLGLGEADIASHKTIIRSAILFAHRKAERPFGVEISYLLDKHPELAADDSVFDALCWYVEFGSQPLRDNPEEPEKPRMTPFSIEQAIAQGDKLYTRALNGQRASAADTLARVLWTLDGRREQAWDLMERRIRDEPEISVRCVLIHPLLPLYNDNSAKSAGLLEQLTIGKTEVVPEATRLLALASRVGTHLLTYVVRRVPDVGERLIRRLLGSTDVELRTIGAWQVIFASFYDDTFIERADPLIAESDQFRLLAADCAADAIVDGELTERALTAVSRYFRDANKEVRAKASEVFRSIPADKFEKALPLSREFIESPAFEEHSFAFFNTVTQALCDVSEIVVSAAERLVELTTNSDARHHFGTALHQLQELLKREYASTEQSPALRKRILDLLDIMLANEMSGTDEVLKAHERD